MAKQKKSGLGRGLSSLLGDAAAESGTTSTAAVQEETVPETPVSSEDDTPTAVIAPAVAEVAADDLTDLTTGAEYVESERAAEEAEQAVVTEREARPAGAHAAVPTENASTDDNVYIKGILSRSAVAENEIELSLIVPNPDQPRTFFKKEDLEELANSIEKEGLLQPILVRKVGETYQIIAGERRWQACKQIGLKTVPVRILDTTDDKAIELALVENIQRSDLNPIEEAYGYKRLMERKGMTQSEVAAAVSKGRSTIANALRLLDLPEDAQQLLYEEKITAGHARAILSIPTREGRQKLTEKLKNERLSVRETETLARLMAGAGRTGKDRSIKEAAPAYFKSVARSVREKLNTNVRIRNVGGKNKLEIEFADESDLKRMLAKLLDD